MFFEDSSLQKFDGVAVNNEAFTQIKCGNDVIRTSFLDKLQEIRNEAAKQKNGKLYTHYSVSWNWGLCQNKLDDIHWHNSIKPAPWHMIDIFDSIDIQDSPCQISFFPEYCRGHTFSETDMFNRYDRMKDFGIGYARPCIHAFREIYSSGGHHLWPPHQ
ncbi:hypothetical protein FSP39_011909 [Pinctada imbricata]|uniref:Uncharacterized protein n=1 Tax=Pinctada imbricata TaxID=66713 RepID=A0AA88XLY5_PINIB|nr:hypothetical protein FSP39_011909 [Pinctada imbricata]